MARRRPAGSARRSRRFSGAKVSLRQIAVLVRAGFQTREFEERFITLGLPYRVIGGPRFYERQEIRDAMAYLRIGAFSRTTIWRSSGSSIRRSRGVGAGTIQQLYQLCPRPRHPSDRGDVAACPDRRTEAKMRTRACAI